MTHRIKFEVPGGPKPWQRTGKNRRKKTESRDYQKLVADFAYVALCEWQRTNGEAWPQKAYYRLTIDTFAKNRRVMDLSNIRKQVEDALSGVLYFDDCRVWAEAGERYIDAKERVEVMLEVIDK